MESLTTTELARIAATQEQSLLQFFAIDEYRPNDHIPNQLERHRNMLKNDLSEFVTFTLNGVPGLYKWVCGEFTHFNFSRWTATCEVESKKYRGRRTRRKSWTNWALSECRYWERDVESRLFRVVAHMREPECRGRGHLSCTWADVLPLLETVESYKNAGDFDAQPSRWDMPFELTVADLEESRKVIDDEDEASEVVRAMHTLSKKGNMQRKWVVWDGLGIEAD